jgi:hypothetical protein
MARLSGRCSGRIKIKRLKIGQSGQFCRIFRKTSVKNPRLSTVSRPRLDIGSGSVELKIKPMGNRVKITGSQWKSENIPQILRLRCAYLNGDISLSIYTWCKFGMLP